MGWRWANLAPPHLATLSFDRYKIAQTLQGRSCTLCFETVIGMNKITPPQPLKKISKKFFKKFFLFFDFFKNLFKGVGLATLSFNRCNMAQGLLRRNWFKYLNIMKNLPLSLPFLPTFQKF